MRWLVTLAQRGQQPYWSGALALRDYARSVGWAFAAIPDCRGDRPWQAKRFCLRAGFQRGPERLFYSDSDVVIHRAGTLLRIMNQGGRRGIWAQYPIAMDEYFARQGLRNGEAMTVRVRGLYRALCRELGAGDGAPHFSDWFVGYNINPETGLRLCDVWDRVAQRLSEEGLTWSDGVSIGIAARVCGVPIHHNLRHRDVQRALEHLRNGDKHDYFAEKGTCQP